MSDIVSKVTELVTPIVEELHFELVEVEYVKEGANYFLRVFVDKPGGIDIDETSVVSEKLSVLLDAITPDPFPDSYFLEVSSPGAERPLKKESDFENAVGQYIHVSLYQSIDKVKVFEGDLVALNPDTLTLNITVKTRQKEVVIERKNIAKARLAIRL